MTYEEAKKLLKRHCGGCMHPQQIGWCKSHCEIGMSIEALEKHIPKKPIYTFIDGFTLSIPYYCPVCGERISKYDAYARCVFKEHHCRCGQAIDWSEAE